MDHVPNARIFLQFYQSPNMIQEKNLDGYRAYNSNKTEEHKEEEDQSFIN